MSARIYKPKERGSTLVCFQALLHLFIDRVGIHPDDDVEHKGNSIIVINKKWNDYVTDGLYICGEGWDWFHDNS